MPPTERVFPYMTEREEKAILVLQTEAWRHVFTDDYYAKAIASEEAFERWAIGRYLDLLRSIEYHDSAEYHYLRSEWERSL